MKKQKVYYEQEDDVLNIWLPRKNGQRIDYAEDDDGVIIHYTKNREPVYIEILDASRFLGKGYKPFYKRTESTKQSSVAIQHRINRTK